MLTLDDVAKGITYNKTPYTTNDRFSVLVPDIQSQHKFFSVNNYTHKFINKGEQNQYKETSSRKTSEQIKNETYNKDNVFTNPIIDKKKQFTFDSGRPKTSRIYSGNERAIASRRIQTRLKEKLARVVTPNSALGSSRRPETCKVQKIPFMKVLKLPTGEVVKLNDKTYLKNTYGGSYI